MPPLAVAEANRPSTRRTAARRPRFPGPGCARRSLPRPSRPRDLLRPAAVSHGPSRALPWNNATDAASAEGCGCRGLRRPPPPAPSDRSRPRHRLRARSRDRDRDSPSPSDRSHVPSGRRVEREAGSRVGKGKGRALARERGRQGRVPGFSLRPARPGPARPRAVTAIRASNFKTPCPETPCDGTRGSEPPAAAAQAALHSAGRTRSLSAGPESPSPPAPLESSLPRRRGKLDSAGRTLWGLL